MTSDKDLNQSTNDPDVRGTPVTPAQHQMSSGTTRTTTSSTAGRDIDDRAKDDNPDAITGAPGSHPVGTGIGAAGAGAAGAAIGAALGPVGSVAGGVIGAVVGAVAGGLAGKGAAEAINPTDEDAYWRANYKNRPYYTPGSDYENYEGDYRHGYESTTRYTGSFDEAEADLRRDWEARPENRGRTWEESKAAVRDAYHRIRDRSRT
jgi:hypothetical protein